MIAAKKIGVSFGVLLVLLGTIMSIFPGIASAATGVATDYGLTTDADGKVQDLASQYILTWVDAAHLKLTFANKPGVSIDVVAEGRLAGLDTEELTDSGGDLIIRKFKIPDWPSNCYQKIEIYDNDSYAPTGTMSSAQIDLDFRPNNRAGCKDSGELVELQTKKTEYSNSYFRWVDSGNIETVTNMEIVYNGDDSGMKSLEFLSNDYKQDPTNDKVFNSVSEEGKPCQDIILVDRAANTMKYFMLSEDGKVSNGDGYTSQTSSSGLGIPEVSIIGCQVIDAREEYSSSLVGGDDYEPVAPQSNFSYLISAPENAIVKIGEGEKQDALDPNGAANDSQSCEFLGGAFSFVLCPALKMMDDSLGWLDDRIIAALNVNAAYYNTPGVKGAWANMRNIAYILLIPVLLIMVIGTALGFSFVDAYTVKRALPRLIIAIVFIALSFEIAKLLVELSNIVGRGTAGVIAQPFGGMTKLQLDHLFTPNAGTDVTFLAGAVVGSVIAYLSGVTIWGIAITIGMAALAMLVVFIILTVREILIIFLMILAPLAILSWIFPGNDKPWKLWWGTFSKMLIFFPLVMGLIVSGRAFASVVNATGSKEIVVIGTIVKLIAFIGPYFFIPAAFKFAGGALGNLAGMVNDKSKGIFDRGKKARSSSFKNKRERNDAGKGVRKTGFIGKRLSDDNFKRLNNRIARTTAIARVASDGGGLKDWKQRTDAAVAASIHKGRGHIMEDKDVATWIGNDTVSGLASDVMAGNLEGLRSVMANTFGYTGDDLDARVNHIIQLRNDGKLQEAIQEAFDMGDDVRSTNRAFQGDANFRNVSVAQVMQAHNKFGDEELVQAMVLKAMAGGTYYADGMDTWRASELSAGHDRNAKAQMAIEGRKLQTATGRYDTGGASFGQTLAIQSEIEQGMAALDAGGTYAFNTGVAGAAPRIISTQAELTEAVNRRMINTVIEQNGAGVLAHSQQKTGYIENNVIPVMQERLQNAYDTHGADSQQYKAEVASAESLWKSLGQTKPEMMKVMGDQVMAYDPTQGRPLTAAEQTAMAAGGGPLTTVQGEVRRFVHSADVVYQNYQYQFQQAGAAAGAGGGGAAPGATPGAPVGGGGVGGGGI